MKQAIQEGFILDVLKHYTPVNSYYRLVKTVEDDPEFDTKKAQKKLRRYVEGHDYAIRHKAEIMVDHFHDQVHRPEQDRRPGPGDGGDQRHRARHPVLPRHPRLPAGAQEPLQGHRRLFRRARVRRRQGDRSLAQRLPQQPDRRPHSRKTPIASWCAPTNSRPATTNHCFTRCTWTRCCPASRRCRRCPG